MHCSRLGLGRIRDASHRHRQCPHIMPADRCRRGRCRPAAGPAVVPGGCAQAIAEPGCGQVSRGVTSGIRIRPADDPAIGVRKGPGLCNCMGWAAPGRLGCECTCACAYYAHRRVWAGAPMQIRPACPGARFATACGRRRSGAGCAVLVSCLGGFHEAAVHVLCTLQLDSQFFCGFFADSMPMWVMCGGPAPHKIGIPPTRCAFMRVVCRFGRLPKHDQTPYTL